MAVGSCRVLVAESGGMGANGCNPLLFLRLTASVKDVLDVVVRLWERGKEGEREDEYQHWQSVATATEGNVQLDSCSQVGGKGRGSATSCN